MKILVFEYITGGGFNKQALPDSLANQGGGMMNALLDNLSRLNDLEITVMLDQRLGTPTRQIAINTFIVRPEHDINEEFIRLVQQSDLVWPIAPEFDHILQNLCQIVADLGKTLLTSPATAVATAGNKFETYQRLKLHHVNVVPTQMFVEGTCPESFGYGQESSVEGSCPELVEGWMIKPVDGVGCAGSYLITHAQDFELIPKDKAAYIIQPHLQGEKTSLSCLFKQGRGWLVCVNLQCFELRDKQYHLTNIVVNHHPDPGCYQALIDQIALAMPELWGYIGIDLIETVTQTWVLEINPRLTTSFVGIDDAVGINVAEAVLQMLHGEPKLKPTGNKSINVQAHAIK